MVIPVAETLNLSTLAKKFSDESAAWEHVERTRWPNGPVCPHCGVVNHAYFLEPKAPRETSTGKVSYRRVWKCADCREQFSVLVGTIFEDSKIPLSKWLLAIHMLCAGKNGASAHELHRDLGITYKSAWFMAHRIRLAMQRPPLVDKLTGTVEADETYMGGEAKNMHASKREKIITGRGVKGKVPVVTLVERGGEARSMVMNPVSGKNVKRVLQEHVSHDAALMTDAHYMYTEPGKAFASHEAVDHKKGEYVRGNAHSNTVEGYFSQLKRSLDGTYHHVSEQHLHRYLSEFDYRYSSRGVEDGTRSEQAIRQSGGKRLTYRPTLIPSGTSAE